jgi:hypothetical protein
MDRLETTEQKEKEKSASCRSRPRDGRQLVDGTGRGVWRLRQRKKKEKKIKGIDRRWAGSWIGPDGGRSRKKEAAQCLDRLLHFARYRWSESLLLLVVMKVMNYTRSMATKHSKISAATHRASTRVGSVPEKPVWQSPVDHARFSGHVAKLLSLQSEITAEASRSLPLARVISQTDPRFRPLVAQLEQLARPGADDVGLLDVPETHDAALPSPFASARARGQQFVASEYRKPENLTLEDASVVAGCSERVLNQRRQDGKVYALLPPGKSRGFRYPSWQFEIEPDRLELVLAPFFARKTSSWVVHHFMLRPNDALGGMRPADYLLDANRPVDTVVAAVIDSLPRDQGAA